MVVGRCVGVGVSVGTGEGVAMAVAVGPGGGVAKGLGATISTGGGGGSSEQPARSTTLSNIQTPSETMMCFDIFNSSTMACKRRSCLMMIYQSIRWQAAVDSGRHRGAQHLPVLVRLVGNLGGELCARLWRVRFPFGLSYEWRAKAYRFANFSVGGPYLRMMSGDF